MTSDSETSGSTAEDAAQERIALLVLGMHRSGTSMLSGILARLGCTAPATPIGAEPENPAGFYESRPVARLNDAILSSAGSAWHDWTAFAPDWCDGPHYETYAGRATSLIDREFGAAPLIVLKDPRICRLAPFWIAMLGRTGYAPRVVLTYRAAENVAQSLFRRQDFDPAFGRLLWLRHVLDAEHDSRDLPRTVIAYDRLVEDWRREIWRLTEDLALPWDRAAAQNEIDAFVAPALRHFQSLPAHSDGWIGTVEAILDRWACTGEDAADHATLDRIRSAFEAAVPVFSSFVRPDPGSWMPDLPALELPPIAPESDTPEAGEAALRRELARRGEKLLEAEHRLQLAHRDVATLGERQIELRRELAEARQEASEQAALRTRMARLGRAYAGWRILRLWRDLRTLRASEIFDAGHYLARNPDVQASGMSPARHYLLHGCAEGRDPGPAFSTLDYYRRNPDVLAANANAALHYIRHGRRENRPV